MKRPMVLLGAVLLSGATLGLREANPLYRVVASLIAVTVIVYVYEKSKALKKEALLFVMFGFVFAFLLAFFRASYQTKLYTGEALKPFYDKYRATNPGQFDYAMYLKTMGVTDEAGREMLGRAKLLGSFRERLSLILDSSLSEHDAGIYRAMLLGDKSSMDSDVKDLYKASGLSHLLAVSGLHVSLIGMSVFNILFNRFKTKSVTATLTASIVTVVYVLMTGASASSVRAGTMLILSIVGRFLGKKYDMPSAMALPASVLVLINPYILFSSGFYLSFLAIVALFFASDLVNGHKDSVTIFRKIIDINLRINPEGNKSKKTSKPLKKLRETVFEILPVKILGALIPSLFVTLFTLPIILKNYYKVPLFSPFLNILVIPLMSIVMISGIAVLAVGLPASIISGGSSITGVLEIATVPGKSILTDIAAAPGHYILVLYEKLSELSTRLPFSVLIMGEPKPYQIIIYYVLLAFFMYFLRLNAGHNETGGNKENAGRKTRQAIIKEKGGLIYGVLGKDNFEADQLWQFIKSKITGCGITETVRRFLEIKTKPSNTAGSAWKFIGIDMKIPLRILFAIYIIFIIQGLRQCPGDGVFITALDVGQGDCFHIHAGETDILIDGGSSRYDKVGKNIIEPYLLSQGITTLDYVFISHSDDDHTNGIKHLLGDSSNIAIRNLMLPYLAQGDDSYDSLKELAGYVLNSQVGNTHSSNALAKSDAKVNTAANTMSKRDNAVFNTVVDTSSKNYYAKFNTAANILPESGNTEVKTDVSYLRAGSSIVVKKGGTDNAYLTCIYSKETPVKDTNSQSAVMLFEYCDFTMLFTGDITDEEEKDIVRMILSDNNGLGKNNNNATNATTDTITNKTTDKTTDNITNTTTGITTGATTGTITDTIGNIDILKVSHHGSKTASSDIFIKTLSPRFALLSYKKGNNFGHPHKNTVETLEKYGVGILRTAESGAITISIDSNSEYRIRGFIGGG